MKTTKEKLLGAVRQTCALSAIVVVMPAMAQSNLDLAFQPELPNFVAEAASAGTAPAAVEALDEGLDESSAQSYLDQILRFEMEYGPYDRRLAESLQAAAAKLEQNLDPLQASQLYERALHITRINDGLYSKSQIGIVKSLINCLATLEEWEVVDRHFRYLHLLYTRLYESGSVELDRGLAQISDWHVLAINNGIGSDREDHMREAIKLFRQRLALAEQFGHADEEEVAFLQRNLAVTQYNLRLMNSDGRAATFRQLAHTQNQLARRD